MRRRKAIIQLTVFVLVTVLALVATLRSGNTPLLGLDLQGGVSVVLSPKTAAGDEELNQAIAIMRQRIDALGVAEPEITRQGDNILVNIAGVKDTDAAIAQVGQTAELRFRPVLDVQVANQPPTDPESPPGTDVPGSTVPGTVPTDPAATTDAITTDPTAPESTVAPGDTTEGSQGVLGGAGGESAALGQDPPTTDPTASDIPVDATVPADPNATVPIDPTASTLDPNVLSQPVPTQTGGQLVATPPGEEVADQEVVLPEYDADGNVLYLYRLGPTQLTGSSLEGASAGVDQKGKWVVYPKFKPGAEGIDAFNAAAQVCKPASAACPTGQQAITLDGRVISAPRIQPESQVFQPFSADQVNISGSFDQDSANALSTALRYGSLPIELERQSTQIVSASIGIDALHAGLIAGAVGLILAAIYMALFYRILGVMSLFKLAVEAALLYTIVTWLGVWAGLSLTLAGVTGIIVSIGVSLDSNVVYYEHLREDVRNGRTIRSAVDRSFHASFSTILKANGASILGAALLYFLAVGPVRGFAFFLGLSTVLDLFTSYFFMRPVVFLTTSAKLCHTRPAFFGLPVEAANREETTTARARPGRRASAAGSTRSTSSSDDADVDAEREPAEPTGAPS